MESKVRESRPLQIGDNVYWISAAAAARCARNREKATTAWRLFQFGRGMQGVPGTHLYMQTKAVAVDVAAQLEELVRTRFLQAIGLAFAGGISSASMLSLM